MIYKVAEHLIEITMAESEQNTFSMLPSFTPFVTEESGDLLFSLHVDDSLRADREIELIGDFELGDGSTKVYLRENGGYQYIISNLHGVSCCLLKTDKEFRNCQCALRGSQSMRHFGLNNAIMFIFAFAGSFKKTLLIHASTIKYNGYGYPFIAKSGTGKSTHSQLWLDNIPGAELMNDDNPAVRIIDGKAYIFGTPWSGKTPCYRQVSAPLGAVTRIDRALKNSIEQLKPVESFASFLPSCSSMKWDLDIYDNICQTITEIIEQVPIYTMHCLPDADAAHVCSQAIAKR